MILARKQLDSHTDFIITEYNKTFNTIKSAFLIDGKIQGEKETSIHTHHNEILNTYRPYIIRLMQPYYLDQMEWA